MRAAGPGACGTSGGIDRDPKRSAVDRFFHGVRGTVVAVAVAALALWPHVRTLFE